MNRIAGITGTLTVVAALGCGGEPGALPASSEPVDVMVSTSAVATGITAAPATVVATRQAALATRASGIVRAVEVDIGMAVRQGQALVRLDTRDIEARVSAAAAAAELARRSHDRVAALAADGAATAQELDDARGRLEMAEAALREARAQLNYVVLRAPFDGVITARTADPGDLAVPGRPVLEMIGTDGLKIEADLPGERAGRIAVGDELAVYQPESGSRYTARVTRAVPALERSSRRFRIEARFAAESEAAARLAPGAFVRIELDEPGATTRWVPADAVVTRGQLNGVYVVEGDELRLRWVRIGQRYGEAVELLAGPGPDALLVRDPAPALVDGQAVGEVRRRSWQPPFVSTGTASAEGGR